MMNPVVQQPIAPTPLTGDRLARLSVAQYHAMIESSVLKEDDPVELLEGLLIVKWPRSPMHDSTLCILYRSLARLLHEEWSVRVRCALTTEDSEPEPDLAVVAGPPEGYLERHPVGSDAGLVVEVADSSLDDDRAWKSRIYARAGVPVYWIVNLRDLIVEAYTLPRTGRSAHYRERKDYTFDHTLSLELPAHVPLEVRVRELLPRQTKS